MRILIISPFLSASLSSAFIVPNNNAIQTNLKATIPETQTAPKAKSPMFEYLKFDGKPTFDVLQKTKDYIETQQTSEPFTNEDLYDPAYVLRGPVIGPINRADLQLSQRGLGLFEAYPNVRIETFGYTVDPDNPYRCLYFQRWRAVQEGDLDAYGQIYPATFEEAETPLSVFSVVWTPEGKIIYEQVGAVVDRFEGNTQGKAAVFGLLHNAGLMIAGNPGGPITRFTQRLGHFIGGLGRSWSEEDKIPSWWKSASRGADETDQF